MFLADLEPEGPFYRVGPQLGVTWDTGNAVLSSVFFCLSACDYLVIGNPLAGGEAPIWGGDNSPDDDSGGGDYTSDYTSPNIGTLKYVPAGSFQRDSTDTNISIISEPYRMSQYEITRQQFYDIMGTDPSDTATSSDTTATSETTTITDPVQNVNWYHAIAFCNKLSTAEGLTPVYEVEGISDWADLLFGSIPTGSTAANWDAATADWNADGYRLPTEMEWMWVAMGADLDSQDGAMQDGANVTGYNKDFAGYDGTNNIGDYAVYGYSDDPKNDGQTTTERTNPVGSKTPNELGLYDMSGNVYEWCWDWYETPYPAGERTDYRGASSGSYRAVHGGGWKFDASECTVSLRSLGTPFNYSINYGFRVVRP